MGFYSLCFLLPLFFVHGLSSLDIFTGYNASVLLPPVYDPTISPNASLLYDGDMPLPRFTVMVTAEPFHRKYTCALAVLLDDTKVWASDHLHKFFPTMSCTIQLTMDGDLQLWDFEGTGQIGWRSGTSRAGAEKLHLTKNTGNLILSDAKNQTVWQTFDHPTDVMLWGQRLNTSAGLASFPANSSAYYSLEVQPDKLVTYLNWRDHKYSYWELRPRKGGSFSFMKLGSRGLKLFDENSRKIAQLLAKGPEPVRFLKLGDRGNLELFHYSAEGGNFEASFSAVGFCDLPLPCGLYGICTPSGTCSYNPLSETIYSMIRDFRKGQYNGFCKANSSRIRMERLQGLDTALRASSPTTNVSKEECLASCMKECSCAAARYSSGGGGSERECSHYGLVAGVKEIGERTGFSYWVKVPEDVEDNHGLSRMAKILIAFGVLDGVAFFVILGAGLHYCRIHKRTVSLGDENS